MLRENIEAIKWLISVSKGNRLFLLASIFLAILGGIVSVIPLIVIYEATDAILNGTIQGEFIVTAAVTTASFIVLKYLLLFSATMCSHRAAFDIQCNVRKDLLEHVGGLPLGFFSQKSSGLLRKITSEDVENLEIYIAHHLPDTALSMAVPITIFAILFSHNALLPIVLFIPFLIMVVALSKISKIRKEHVQEYFDNTENMNSATIEYIKAIPIIKIFNVTVESFSKFNTAIKKQIEITSEWIKLSSPFYVLFKSSLDFVLPLLMFAMALFIRGGVNVNMSTYILCFILGAAMIKPINQIYTSSNLLCSLMEGARRVEQVMDNKPIAESAHTRESVESFAIKYENVSFSYGDKTVLDDINIALDKPGLYALVGESGSGKTTTAQLLLRFWEIEEGEISIGGVDIRELSLDFLLKHISFVFQDPFIIDGTIRENICMGQNDVSDEAIVSAAKTVAAHDFIEQLPQGYDTIIGAEGSRLSGGEKQRVCLARAILKKAPILVLDEPTSQVDATIERNIFDAIKRDCSDKIVIFITHRMTAAVNADKIFVFDSGKLVDSGPHGTLLSASEKYGRMWELANRANNWSLGKGSKFHAA